MPGPWVPRRLVSVTLGVSVREILGEIGVGGSEAEAIPGLGASPGLRGVLGWQVEEGQLVPAGLPGGHRGPRPGARTTSRGLRPSNLTWIPASGSPSP